MDISNILIEQSINAALSTLFMIIYGRITQRKFYKNGSFDPVMIFVFLTSFSGIATIFSFIYNWEPFNIGLTVLTTLLLIVTVYVKDIQCPKCRRLQKALDNVETLKEEKRPYVDRSLTIKLNPDGTEKSRIHGKSRIVQETWRLEKYHYRCNSCGNKWSKTGWNNIDEQNRSRPDVIREKETDSGSSAIF